MAGSLSKSLICKEEEILISYDRLARINFFGEEQIISHA